MYSTEIEVENTFISSDQEHENVSRFIPENSLYRKEIIKHIEELKRKLYNQKPNRRSIQNQLKLLQMKEEAAGNGNLTTIEKELWTLAVEIEDPVFKMLNSIAIIVFLYTLAALIGFFGLTSSSSIMLPSFNIPYSVLLMGLIGSLVSMYVKLYNIRKMKPESSDSTVWFIINPPIAVVMAGIFFGIVQMFVPVIPFEMIDESWPFWILAWIVGLNNWVFMFERFSSLAIKKKRI